MTADEDVIAELQRRITDYLTCGGLFNPEMAIHDLVRDLLIDCREALSRVGGRDAEIRRNEDCSLDEIVGSGPYHLEQMSSVHWWMRVGDVAVNLHSAKPISATVERDK